MKTAFVFPGQGSQSANMLADVVAAFPSVRQRFTEASDLLGYDLAAIIYGEQEAKLNQTVYTQPALFAVEFMMWEIWCQAGGERPTVLAGHSLGEYVALAAAGVVSFGEGITLVSERAKFMQEAVPEGEGAMAAIVLLPLSKIEALCQQSAQGEVVGVANINDANQIVIAGQATAVERVMGLAKEAGAKLVKRLAVSVPSHCLLMRPAAERLAASLRKLKLQAPTIPVINNVDVAMPVDVTAITEALIRQVYKPVRWMETIEKMAALGIEAIVECGPGKVLSGLNRRICPKIEAFNLNSVESLQTLLAIKKQEKLQ